MKDITVRYFKGKKAKTLPHVTLGECKLTHRPINEVSIYLDTVSDHTVGDKKMFDEYVKLTLLHELHHAILGNKSNEKEADLFAIKTYRQLYGKKAKYARQWAGR